VKEQRGVDGAVRILDETRTLESPVEPSVFEGPMVVVNANGALDRYVHANRRRGSAQRTKGTGSS
jgi:hypothetical protein